MIDLLNKKKNFYESEKTKILAENCEQFIEEKINEYREQLLAEYVKDQKRRLEKVDTCLEVVDSLINDLINHEEKQVEENFENEGEN